MISGYPKIYSLGHRELRGLFEGGVEVQEKVDGSQISFSSSLLPNYSNSGPLDVVRLEVRSKEQSINIDAPPKMFLEGVDVIRQLPLHLNWIYRGD